MGLRQIYAGFVDKNGFLSLGVHDQVEVKWYQHPDDKNRLIYEVIVEGSLFLDGEYRLFDAVKAGWITMSEIEKAQEMKTDG